MKNEIIEIVLVIIITLICVYNSIFAILYLSIIILELMKNLKMDEMERSLRQAASDFTFYALIGLSILLLSIKQLSISKEIIYLYILFPLVVRNLLYIGSKFESKKSSKLVGYSLIIITSSFIILSSNNLINFVMEALIPITILIVLILSFRFPKVGIIGFVGLFLIFSYYIFRNGINFVGQLLTYFIIAPAFIFLAYQNFRRIKNENDSID